jgi:hypothetical protein
MRADALAHPIEPITPWVEERDGERFITIPAISAIRSRGEAGRPVARLIRRAVGWLAAAAPDPDRRAAYLFGRDYVRKHPQDVPWTALDLATRSALHAAQARGAWPTTGAVPRAAAEAGLADRARAAAAQQPSAATRTACALGRRRAASRPRAGHRCPVAAALLSVGAHVLQPAASATSERGAAVEHAGSYSCRRLYGRARALQRACDRRCGRHPRLPAGRRTRISVLRDWARGGQGAFLREVRDGACDLFATVLSPDYNEAHADHLHFDQAARGRCGFAPVPLGRASRASAPTKKGTRRSGSPSWKKPKRLFQMVRQMLVHLEHAARSLPKTFFSLSSATISRLF